MSAFWFTFLQGIVPNHMISCEVDDFPQEFHPYREQLQGRSMLVRKTSPILIECVARRYLAGSGWKDYQKTGAVCGIFLPPGLRKSDRLPEDIFAPATKAETGHDVNIDEEQMSIRVGSELTKKLKDYTLELFKVGADYADSKGILLADTKFEFGILDDKVILIDEVLTPDSSRFWPKDRYQPGQAQPSFDKQPLRDYLDQIGWDKNSVPPSLPTIVANETSARYLEAYRLLAG